jgi:hypothetical protein
MATTNLDHADATAALAGGVIREDVMNEIWNLSKIPLPLTDLIGSGGKHTNRYCEWTEDKLTAPNLGNAVVDGADIAQNNTVIPSRLGNYTQISVKEVQISHSAESADSIGNSTSMSYQVTQRQQELRRDVEAIQLSLQGSVAGDGATIAGLSAGLGAQLKTNISLGATGVAGGFNTTTKLFVAPVPGTKRALSETLIRDILQGVYVEGGNTTTLMARPPVIRKLSEYLFTATARVANMQANQAQNSPSSLTAYGSVNVFVTDFGQTVQMRDNRLQQVDAAGTSSMYFIDPTHMKQSFLRGYQAEPLGKTGLNDKKLMSVEWSLKVLNEKSQGAIFAIDEALAVVA